MRAAKRGSISNHTLIRVSSRLNDYTVLISQDPGTQMPLSQLVMSKIHRSCFSRAASVIIKSSSARAGKLTIIENRTFIWVVWSLLHSLLHYSDPAGFTSLFLCSPSTPLPTQSSTSLKFSVIHFLLKLFSSLCPQRMPYLISNCLLLV